MGWGGGGKGIGYASKIFCDFLQHPVGSFYPSPISLPVNLVGSGNKEDEENDEEKEEREGGREKKDLRRRKRRTRT